MEDILQVLQTSWPILLMVVIFYFLLWRPQKKQHCLLYTSQAVTGYGKADKNQVIYMTMNILGIREKIKPDDTADALAVAICTAHSSHNDRLKRLV